MPDVMDFLKNILPQKEYDFILSLGKNKDKPSEPLKEKPSFSPSSAVKEKIEDVKRETDSKENIKEKVKWNITYNYEPRFVRLSRKLEDKSIKFKYLYPIQKTSIIKVYWYIKLNNIVKWPNSTSRIKELFTLINTPSIEKEMKAFSSQKIINDSRAVEESFHVTAFFRQRSDIISKIFDYNCIPSIYDNVRGILASNGWISSVQHFKLENNIKLKYSPIFFKENGEPLFFLKNEDLKKGRNKHTWLFILYLNLKTLVRIKVFIDSNKDHLTNKEIDFFEIQCEYTYCLYLCLNKSESIPSNLKAFLRLLNNCNKVLHFDTALF
jgi:hypothetical protein